MFRAMLKIKNPSGMTLVEILISIVILGLILVAIFPLLTQSLQVVNLSNVISKQLFDTQDTFEVVSVTKDGALLEDGTFIPVSSFAVFSTDRTTWVSGMTITKKDLVRFLASRLGYRNYRFSVNEGYTLEEGTFTIENRSIMSSEEYFITIDGKEGDSHSISGTDMIRGDGYITFSLPTNKRLNNYNSPYQVTVKRKTLDETTALGSLFVYLPKTVLAKSSQGLLISSTNSPAEWERDGNWVEVNKSLNKINKIVHLENPDQNDKDCFVAIADGGLVYQWQDGSNGFETAETFSGKNLNDIILSPDGVMIVGDGGIIIKGYYTFNNDAVSWDWIVIRGPGSGWINSNLNAIAYNDEKGEYYIAGNEKLLLRLKIAGDDENGTETYTVELLTSQHPLLGNMKSNMPAVYFSPKGDYLKTETGTTVSGKNHPLTIIMAIKPEVTEANLNLLTMASENSSTGFLLLRTDANGKLAVQNNTSSMATAAELELEAGKFYIVSCRYANKDDIILSLNGKTQKVTLPDESDFNINTNGDIQLGSAELTSVIGTTNFTGYIGDVFVFNCALRVDSFPLKSGFSTYHCAPEMDIVTHYLSKKYDVSTSIDKELHYYREGDLWAGITTAFVKLKDLHWRSGNHYWITLLTGNENTNWWPYKTGKIPEYPDFSERVIWLDAFNSGYGQDARVSAWNSRKESHQLSVPALKSFNAIALNQSAIITGGDEQNLFQYDTERETLLESSGNNAPEYVIRAMLLVGEDDDSEVVTILNSSSGHIAKIIDDGNDVSITKTVNNQLNSISAFGTESLLVTGNSGTLLYSEDNGENWTSVNSVSSHDLLAASVRN